MKIVTSPDSLIFAGNLNEIILSDVEATGVQVVMYETGNSGNLILDEIYVPDADGKIYIDVKSVITELLTSEIPPLDVLENNTSGLIKSFTLTFNGTQTVQFSVINGGIDKEENTATFLQHNFLTWQQGFRYVCPQSLVFLSYMAQEDCLFKLSVHFESGRTSEISIALSEGDCKSFNLSPKFLNGYFTGTVISGEAWVESYAGYYLTDKAGFEVVHPDNAEVYLYANSLGGIDSLIFTGEYTETLKTKTELSAYRSKSYENRIEITKIRKQNTGFITNAQFQFVTDFLLSKSRFYVSGDSLIPIVIEESETNFVRNNLNASEFEYRFAELSPYLHLPHKEGFTPGQLPPFWDKVGACFDQKKGNKIIDRTRGYIATLSEDGVHIDFPQLIPDAMRRKNTAFWLSDMPANEARRWRLDELTGTFTIDFATDTCSRMLFFRDIKNANITTALPVIIYKSELSDPEIEQVLQYLKEYYFLEDAGDSKLLTKTTPAEGNNTFIIDNSTLKI